MIELQHITKEYIRGVPAVNDLSFHIPAGTVCGLLGRNGAGKSTTLNMLTGCIAPTSGKILIGGHDLYDEPVKAHRLMGYAPELPPLYPDMTLREYLTFVSEAKNVPFPAKEAVRCMELTSTTPYADSLMRTLSKGTRQRAGLAQALVGDPPVLILDEPSIGLDPEQISRLRTLISNLGKTHTVLLSSHILSEVTLLCGHLLLLSQGKLVFDGTPDTLLEQTGSESLEQAFLSLTADSDEEQPTNDSRKHRGGRRK